MKTSAMTKPFSCRCKSLSVGSQFVLAQVPNESGRNPRSHSFDWWHYLWKSLEGLAGDRGCEGSWPICISADPYSRSIGRSI